MPASDASVELYWIPLGAGGHSVRLNGKVYEALTAARSRREQCDLYHAALVLSIDGERHTIEVTPSPDADDQSRGVVATGAVGSRWAGWLRLFRYEVRCWPGGTIPDLRYAVETGQLTDDPRVARRLLALVPTVPTPVWGRDELRTGDMWNSNSVVAWLIATAGLPTDGLRPPPHGRAPGWDAGLELARRSSSTRAPEERTFDDRHEPRPALLALAAPTSPCSGHVVPGAGPPGLPDPLRCLVLIDDASAFRGSRRASTLPSGPTRAAPCMPARSHVQDGYRCSADVMGRPPSWPTTRAPRRTQAARPRCRPTR